MASVKDITSKCKAGQAEEAYSLAKADLTDKPDDVWAQREVGWALYYMLKNDAEKGNYARFTEHLDELNTLTLLTAENDSMIFDNVTLQIGNFVKKHVSLNDIEALHKLSNLFNKIKDYTFKTSIGHSVLLSAFIKFDNWQGMTEFFEWWNLDNLRQEDYTPFVNQNGQKMITLAERAYIAYSKALLKGNDLGRIELFLPKLDALMNAHPEFMYPGYFYGKLLLKLGSSTDEALKVIVPFARKKATEFWVWQLLSDTYSHDRQSQLACLLRAVHCKTKEAFLGKVRIKLSSLYIQDKQFDRAKFHIDAITNCYLSQGWKLPAEVSNWIHEPWLNTASADSSEPINYMEITNAILCNGSEEGYAVVTYIDPNTHRASLIYGKQKRAAQKLRFKVNPGDVLKINYINDANGRIKILNSCKTKIPADLNYAKVVEGTVAKQDEKAFALLKTASGKYFASPNIVQKFKLTNNEQVKALVVLDYDKKKDAWNWTCANIFKQ